MEVGSSQKHPILSHKSGSRWKRRPNLVPASVSQKTIAHLFNTPKKPQSDTLNVPSSSRTSTEEARKPSPDDGESEAIDGEFETELRCALEESLREEAQKQPERGTYALGPSHAWHNAINVQHDQPHSPFDGYPSPTMQNNPVIPMRSQQQGSADSSDDELRKAIEISLAEKDSRSINTQIPTIQIDNQSSWTPQEELQKVLEISRHDY